MEWRLIPPGDPVADSAAHFAALPNVSHLDKPFHQPRLQRTAAFVNKWHLTREGAGTITDLGCGDGGMLSLLPPAVRAKAWGYDIREASVDAAREGCDVRAGDITNPETLEIGGLVVLTETLEHLDNPADLLRRLVACGARWLVASSPWRERPGRSLCPTHVWAWDEAGYRALIERAGWSVVRTERVGVFQIAVASSKAA